MLRSAAAQRGRGLAAEEHAQQDITVPPAPVNAVLTAALRLESWWVRRSTTRSAARCSAWLGSRGELERVEDLEAQVAAIRERQRVSPARTTRSVSIVTALSSAVSERRPESTAFTRTTRPTSTARDDGRLPGP